jgi:hypothetical protein
MNKPLRRKSGFYRMYFAHCIAALLLWQLLPAPVLHARPAAGNERAEVKLFVDKPVKGKVTDPSGEALPGVNVIVKGTTNGTTTDTDGNFALEVPENATLQFSYIGYKTIEVASGRPHCY